MIAAEAVVFRLAEARLGLQQTELEARAMLAKYQIIQLLGLLPTTEITLVKSPADLLEAENHDSASILRRSPAVLYAAANYETAEERLRLEVRKQYPDVSLEPLYAREDGADQLGLGFSVPLPLLNANRQAIAEAEAARNAARAQWEEASHQAVANFARNKAALEAAQLRLHALHTIIVPLAEKQLAEARNLADLGEINTLLILEALRSQREAALELIDAQAAEKQALYQQQFNLPKIVPSFILEAEPQS